MTARKTSDPYRAQSHPELREGEVWFTNSDLKIYEMIGFKTKRRGKTAYDENGNTLSGDLAPVFISRTELNEHQRQVQIEQNRYK